MAQLRLAPGIAQAILAHARAGYPNEVCGLVVGRDGLGTAVYAGRNVAPDPRVTFELDTETLLRLVEFDAAGLDLVAIYHSHPAGPGQPSATDIAQSFYPQAATIICSLQSPAAPVMRAFRIVDGSASEVELDEVLTTPASSAKLD